MLKVSAIIATRGNVPLERCIESLIVQSVPVEIIIIDQGDGRFSREACDRYGETVKRVMCDGVGVSLGRNRGISLVTGSHIIFPDDDCYYSENFLKTAIDSLNANECGFVAGLLYVPGSRERSSVSSADGKGRSITKKNLLYSFIEVTVLFKAEVFTCLRFNELIGVGAKGLAWSDEGADLLLRAMDAGFRGRFDPTLVAYHPEKVIASNPATYIRAFRYSVGRGYTLRRYWLGASVLLREYLRPFFGMLVYGLRFDWRAKYYLLVLAGKLYGFIYRPTNAKR